MPNTISMACRCGAGSRSSRSSSGSAQLMETGVGQLHLRLHPHRPDDRQIRRRRDQVFQQRRLPDPSLAAQHQRLALAAADRRDQVVEQRALARPATQRRAPPRFPKMALHQQRPRVELPKRRKAGRRRREVRALDPFSLSSCSPAENSANGRPPLSVDTPSSIVRAAPGSSRAASASLSPTRAQTSSGNASCGCMMRAAAAMVAMARLPRVAVSGVLMRSPHAADITRPRSPCRPAVK